MNLDVACDDQDDHESKNDDDVHKRYLMFKNASSNSGYIAGIAGQHNSAFTGSNDGDAAYFDDVEYAGRRCKRFMFLDANGNQIPGSTIVLVPYDEVAGKASAYFIANGHIEIVDKKLERTAAEWKDFVKHAEDYARQARINADLTSPVFQKQQIARDCRNGYISIETARRMELQIDYEQRLFEAHKALKDRYNAEHPGWCKRFYNNCFGEKPLPYTEQEYVQQALLIKQAADIDPKNQNKTVFHQANKIIKAEMRKAQAIQAEVVQAKLIKIEAEKAAQAEQTRIDTARAQEVQKAQDLKNAQIQEDAELAKARAESAARQRATQAILARGAAVQKIAEQEKTQTIDPKKQSESTLASITQSVIDRKKNQTSAENNKDSIHCCSMPVKTADDIRHQLITSHHNENKKITTEETAMIDFMLDSMVHAQNNMTVELAQAGLQAWSDAQQAQTDEEYVHYVNKAKNCHNLMYYQTPGKSFIEQGLCVKPSQVDSMLHDCNAAIEHDKKYRSINEQHGETAVTQRLQKRQLALLESQDQIRTGALIYREYQMSYTARGFMITNNINYAAFDPMKATSFQHQLTQENLNIIESSVRIAEQNNFEPAIKEFAEQTCHLAVAAQQLNQLAKIEEAAAVIALNDSYARLMESIADDLAEAKAFRDLGVGVYKGTERALRAWGEFAGKLAMQPVTTVSEIGGNCLAVGNVLLHGAGNLADQALFGPARDSCDDFMQDMQELREKSVVVERKRRSQIRREENIDAIKDAYAASLEIAQQVITNMCKKNTEENIADATQFIVEGIITQKVAKYALQLSKFVGAGLVQGGLELLDKVPSSILDKPIEFIVTPGGAVIGVIAETGESIADIIIAAGQELADPFEKGVHLAAQANNLARKGGGEIQEYAINEAFEQAAFDNGNASSVNAQANLDKKLRLLEKAQENAARVEKLPDGRIRYYTKESLSKTPGPTRGASHVAEYNPSTGQVRSWHECYDQAGNVNRVHPKSLNGQDLIGQHYPPTKLELELFQKCQESQK